MYEYDLFAVIRHDGQIDNGHYTCYARYQDEVRIPDTFSQCTELLIEHTSGIILMTTSMSILSLVLVREPHASF